MRLWLWMWINASYVIICYVFMMLCKLCKSYAMWSWCYASYASFRLCVHDASYANRYDKHWSIMTPCYASLVYDYMQVHIWYVMQVWCMIICKFIYDMLCKFGVWLYASSYMTCYASLVFDYMQVTCASLHLCMICIHMQVNPFVCHTYICKFTPLYDISNLCKLPSLWHMWFMQVWVDYLC